MHSGFARWWVVALLFTGTFINAIDRASLSTAAPRLIQDLHLDEGEMGIALSAFFWFYLLANIPAGRIADRFGSKRTLGWAAVLWSACSALTGRAATLGHILAARAGVGIGEAASFPVNARIVNHSFPPQERGIAVGCYTAGLRLGFAVTPVLMAWLMERCGWRAAFYATGFGSLAWVALWFASYRGENGGPTSAPAAIPWRELLSHRTVRGLVLCKFFQDYLFYLFVTWLPGYLVLERHFTVMKMGWCASMPWVAGFFAQILAGWFSDHLLRRGVSANLARKGLVIVFQILAASVIAAGFVEDALAAVWILTFSVACESAATSLLWTTCADAAPPSAAGSMAGVMNSAGALAGILAPTVTGYLVQFTGNFQGALILGSAMVILAAVSIGFVAGEVKPIALASRG